MHLNWQTIFQCYLEINNINEECIIVCVCLHVYICTYAYKYVHIHTRWPQRQYISRSNSMRILLDHFYYIAQTLLSFFGNILFVVVGMFLCPWFLHHHHLPPYSKKFKVFTIIIPKRMKSFRSKQMSNSEQIGTWKPTFDNLVWQCLKSFCNLCLD